MNKKKTLFSFALLTGVFTTTLTAAPGEASFTPESIKVPVEMVGLHNSNTNTWELLYQCIPAAENDFCRVDLANPMAMNTIFSNPYFPAEGSYDHIFLQNCSGGANGYTAAVKGEVMLNGQTYATVSDPDLVLSTSLNAKDYIAIDFESCGNLYKLPEPVAVGLGESLNLGVLAPIRNIAWGKLGPKTLPAGCLENNGATRSVCMGYPDAVPLVGDPQEIAIENYLVGEYSGNDPAGMPFIVGAVQLLIDNSGQILAGFTRRMFDAESQTASDNFDSQLKTMTHNGGVSYYLENWGSDPEGVGYLRFGDFQRVDEHSSTYLASNDSEIHYFAIRNYETMAPACSNSPMLDNHFIDMNKVDYITPLGKVFGGHVFPTDHIYFVVFNDPQTQVSMVTDVYFPAAAYVTAVSSTQWWNLDGQGNKILDETHKDYEISYNTCNQLKMQYAHIITLDPAMQAIVDEGPSIPCEEDVIDGKLFERCQYVKTVQVTSGQSAGTVGGKEGFAGLDLWAFDFRKEPISFANPARYSENIYLPYTSCGLDYLVPSLYNQVLPEINRAPGYEPICGTIDQDLLGTVQGNWFTPGAPTWPESSHISLVHYNVDPSLPVFSIGPSVDGLTGNTYYFKVPETPTGRVNYDFPTINDSQIYCFDSFFDYTKTSIDNIVFLVQLNSPQQLTIEEFAVADCSVLGTPETWAFSGGEKTFDR